LTEGADRPTKRGWWALPPPPTARTFADSYRDCTIALNGSCPIESGFIGGLADNECKHERLPGDRSAPCGCWPHQEYYRDPVIHEHAVRLALAAPTTTPPQEVVTLSPTDAPTIEAPFGYKADGTPRKRPAPSWLSDPNRVAAAAAKRRGPRKSAAAPVAAPPVATNGAAPAVSAQEVEVLVGMLDRIGLDAAEQLAELDAEEAEELAQVRARFADRRTRILHVQNAVEVGQRLTV
jgi:hypothetical protein